MTQPADSDYTGDVEDDEAVQIPLPEPTDPSTIPPDEGDAGPEGANP